MKFKLLSIGKGAIQNGNTVLTDEFGNEIEVLKLPEDEKGLRELIVNTFNYITDKYFYDKAFEMGGYKNMGKIKVDADSGDEDAKYLLLLYEAVWNAEETVEEEINNMSTEQLKELLPDVPSYLLPKLEAAKQSLESSSETTEEDSTDE